MSEKLIFPIGFDLEEGVKEASKEWKNAYQKQLQKAIDDKPLKAKIELETNGLDLGKLKEFNKISKEMVAASKANAKMQRDNIAVQERQRLADERVAAAHERTLASVARRKKAEEGLNRVYKTQSGYLQRLFQRMVAYASVAQAFSLIRNIREVTAQFELQRVALGSIIGDLNEANAMFEQIKAAAVKSPFQIKELVTYTKQLAAYKIETDELFETTQKLADVSAGLGVGMERLVLAYGQIRATGYLRASEVRQLTEAGIPIVEELAKKMSDLRGETVSAAEVMGMISERAISFGMVKEVFDDMTSAGGMFYKMQEKQAETLAGQLSNLKDSISIMYDEIGRSEYVNSKIKAMIGLVKSLAENWRDVWSVVQSLSVAMGVYYVAMKNAAIASKALSVAEATRLAVENKQMIIIPKWLAFFDRKNRLYKVSIVLEKALAVAQLKTATATNVLSKGFWKLTTAMLSNPYTAVLAALAGITVAIVKFATKTKTTQERIDDLNKSVASLNELANPKNGIKKLIDEFDELSQKANKTAEEQKRLNQVTRALAETYPSAINGVKEYGQEVGVAADKVKELYQSELKLRQDRIRQELKSSEEEYAKLEALYNDYISRINKGTYLQPVVNPNTDEATYYEKAYTEEQLAALGNKALKIADKMRSLATTIKNAKIALGGLNDEGANAVDTFNTWQKELQQITEGTNEFTGKKNRIFDDESIAQTPKLTSALEKVVEKYKKLKEEKKQVDKALLSEGAKADKQTYSQLQERLGKINEGMSGLYGFLKKYGGLDLIKDGDKDGELARLQKELQLHEKIYAKYKEYRKYMSAEEAKAKVEKYFGDTIDALKFKPSFDKSGYQNVLEQYKKVANTLLAKAKDETEKGAIKKFLLDIGFKIDDKDWEDTKQNMEKSLKKLSDDLSRTKTAKEFFDRMLGLTDDKQLSATLTLSVYGTTGDDLKAALVKQVQGAFAGQDLSKAINTDLNSIDLSALREIYNNLPEDFQEKQKQSMKQVLDMLEKGHHDLANNFAKLLMDYDEMEQKRVTITQKATQEIATLEQGLQAQIEGIHQNKEITDKDSAIADATARTEAVRKAILAREKLELSKLSPEYIRFFSSINAMAMETANSTRTKLRRALFDAFEQGGISAEELRKELKAIDTQFNKLNENATLFSSYATGGFDAWLQKLQQSADELDAIAARMMKLESLDQMDEGDKNFVNKMLNIFGGKGQKSLSDLATSFNGDMSQMGDAVQKVGGQMQGMFSSAMGAISIVDAIIKGVGQTIDGVGQVIDQINSMRSEDNQIGGWFKYIQDFNKYAQAGWEDLKSGNIAGALANTVSAIISIFQNIQADKIKKLNEDIERQQELLDQLAYSYERLEKAQEKAFGSDYISNYEQRLANLQAQQEAYLKQAELERSKGKKADSGKIEEYEEAYREATDNIKDMQGELSEYFLGTDLTSAARDFANAWIDAYKEFGSTTDAMKAKFQDMIQNMIVESFAAKVIQSALSDIFTEIDNMTKDGVLDVSEASKIADMTKVAVGNIDVGMTNLMNALSQAGISVRGMGSDLTGISRDIATASEESILGLAAGINTQNFYISQVPTKLDTIIGLLRGENAMQGSAITLQDLVTIQNQHLSYLPSIAQHTAETVAECKQIVAETRRTADALERVIKPEGTRTTYKMNVVTTYQG